ncbi:T9SS type A sorting domain-containing protein [Moheibacter stercoris]|uniref:Secretion system C-terminal sorting domain-containing protein n=1 Tax=Moheibacter stercoris TaxID=1628251 RepID=A0ABV2LV46_9FLAO
MKRILLLMFLSFAALNVHAQSRDGIVVSNPINEKKLTISPNPAVSDVKLTIEGNEADVKSISIYSVIGSEVYSKAYNSSSNTFDLAVRSLKKGKYMVRVIFTDNTSEVVTLIKQ